MHTTTCMYQKDYADNIYSPLVLQTLQLVLKIQVLGFQKGMSSHLWYWK